MGVNIYIRGATVFGCLISSSMAMAGGFELQTLDTSLLYEKGNKGSFSLATISSDVKTTTGVKVLKDQNLINAAAKTDFGPLALSVSTYRSGAIQMSGGAAPVPSADAKIETVALMGKYSLGERFSVLAGVSHNTLVDSSLLTPAGSYNISGTTATGYTLGAAYEIPDIALRLEVLYTPKSEFSTTSSYLTPTGVVANPAASTTLSNPETLAANFQTGIAKDTLLMAFIRHAKWSGSPVNITVGDPLANINEAFGDSTKYSIGLGRRINENLSVSLGYSQEAGGGSTDTSLFTFSNGNKSISIGAKYTLDNWDISGGISYTKFGDVTVNHPLATVEYKDNSAITAGVKIGFSF